MVLFQSTEQSIGEKKNDLDFYCWHYLFFSYSLIVINSMLPQLSLQDVSRLIAFKYNIKGQIKQLPGYSDANYLIKDSHLPHKKYIFKISCQDENEVFLNIQTYVLLRTGQLAKETRLSFPQIIPTIHGEDCLIIETEKYRNFARLLKYVQGNDLWQVQHPSKQLLTDIGVMTAKLSIFLAKISLHQQVKQLVKHIDIVEDPSSLLSFSQKYKENRHHLDTEVKEEVKKVLKEFKALLPRIKQLPLQLIHNDICKSNLLVQKKGEEYRLCGLIDFGDLDHSYNLVQLATVAAEITIDQSNPLKNLMLIIKGYNQVIRLNEVQKELIFPLMKARIAMMTVMIYRDCYYTPESDYLLKNKVDSIQELTIFSRITNQEFQKQLQKYLT